MISSQLVTFGCSLTRQEGWANYISSHQGQNLVNYSIGSSSNQTQIYRFQDWTLCNNNQSVDIIWQITYLHRNGKRFSLDHPDIPLVHTNERCSVTCHTPHFNLIDGTNHVEILDGNEYIRQFDRYRNFEQELVDLLFVLTVAKKLANRLIVFYGDQVGDSKTMDCFSNLLDQFEIINTRIPMVSWARKNSLPFSTVHDHPEKVTYEEYAKQILLPLLT